jgi:outer membrane protein assembly factor BamE (lipoprotein component of BamABCDE complex)
MKILYPLIAASLLAGCVSTGTRFDLAKTDTIQRGKTTAAELENWFGKPFASRSFQDGAKLLTWQYTKAGLAVGIVEQQVLEANVDQNGVVTDYQTRRTSK